MQENQGQKRNPEVLVYLESKRLGQQPESKRFNGSELGNAEAGDYVECRNYQQ